MGALKKLTVIACAVLTSSYAYAESKTIEFSADAVISAPQQIVKQTKLFVGKEAVRSETVINGQNIVEIVYPDKGRTILINDSLKSYKERIVDHQSETKSSGSPCDQISNAVCEKLGVEDISGYKTEKWQIISENNGRKLRTLHWIDVKRKLAIREFFPDGSVAELKMIKKEKVNGRDTEKWERSLSRPDGKSAKSYQWYDSGLKIAIKEELPGGYVRELKNIKISEQAKDLFTVPDDYKKIEFQPAAYPEYRNR
ncbi:MAG: DUF4412 domain-containing protein [Gammaproteobacteria bacterium]|nr:DUF4412 domain-containing protein [Gammaproteobacteria bacterium]